MSQKHGVSKKKEDIFSTHRCRWNYKLSIFMNAAFQLTEAADPKPVHKPAGRVRGTAATPPLDTPTIGEWYDTVSVF